MDGVLNICKTAGPTSHDIVDEVRRLFHQKRVGHAGTLDPMATGVLVVCLGKATRAVEYLMGAPKEYRARMILGVSTDTQDSSGIVTAKSDASSVTREDFDRTVLKYIGEIQQVPPMVSAIKHQGKSLYKLAREGKIVERKARSVQVYCIEVIGFIPGPRAEAEIRVECGSGTYIRTLCSDIGDVLGCGGHMSMLERTRVGRFTIEDAVTTTELAQAKAEGRLENYVINISDALKDMPSVLLDEAGMRRIIHGMTVSAECVLEEGTAVRIIGPNDEMVALGTVVNEDGLCRVQPRKVLVEESTEAGK